MNLEDRIKRRYVIEGAEALDVSDGLPPHIGSHSADIFVQLDHAARIAALEAEDSANPIFQTEQVRPPLRLNIDIAAFQAVYDDLDHE